ncbi:hypothetical protein, partial [Klebsiella pneumoniae]|uniref:hypothetical protein n=1 Tax=Klebsiella pneumoniae TaxID=573 RepID=UPI003EDF5993
MRLTRLCLLPLVLVAACSPSGRSDAQTARLGAPVPGLAAPNRTPPPDFGTMKMSFAPIVKRA